MDGVEKADVLYITGEEGLNVIARDSYHAEVVDMLCNNLAVVDEPSSKGTGNEVDMEQILNWDPSIVFFAPGSIYSTVADNENWQTIPAIKDGRYYEVPFGPYNWMASPPASSASWVCSGWPRSCTPRLPITICTRSPRPISNCSTTAT